MQVMHAEGMVHRDIKPANIMRCRSNLAKGDDTAYTYKLIDFGTALGVDERVARTAMMTIGTNRGIGAGTPPYMSPEMFKVPPATTSQIRRMFGLYLLQDHLLTFLIIINSYCLKND
jgi:serine/threonine protein kinase